MNNDKFSDLKRYALPIAISLADWNNTCLEMAAKYQAAKLPLAVYRGPNLDYIGVEIELENPPKGALHSIFWKVVHEGSLRNGLEFKTFPIKPEYLPAAMYDLSTYLKSGKPDFNERTSVHVHVDFRDYTLVDLVKFMMVYLAFERYLYLYAGPERFKSNFCVPLSLTNVATLHEIHEEVQTNTLTYRTLMDSIHHFLPGKYSGFNVRGLHNPERDGIHEASGTVEFRHMSGNADPQRIVDWVAMILRMKEYSTLTEYKEIEHQILSLNTTSRYHVFADSVFGPLANAVVPYSVNWTLLAKNLRLLKEAFSKKLVVSGAEFLKSPLAAKLQSQYDRPDKKKKPERFEFVDPVIMDGGMPPPPPVDGRIDRVLQQAAARREQDEDFERRLAQARERVNAGRGR